MRLPDPTIVLMVPAAIPAPKTATCSSPVTACRRPFEGFGSPGRVPHQVRAWYAAGTCRGGSNSGRSAVKIRRGPYRVWARPFRERATDEVQPGDSRLASRQTGSRAMKWQDRRPALAVTAYKVTRWQRPIVFGRGTSAHPAGERGWRRGRSGDPATAPSGWLAFLLTCSAHGGA